MTLHRKEFDISPSRLRNESFVCLLGFLNVLCLVVVIKVTRKYESRGLYPLTHPSSFFAAYRIYHLHTMGSQDISQAITRLENWLPSFRDWLVNEEH